MEKSIKVLSRKEQQGRETSFTFHIFRLFSIIWLVIRPELLDSSAGLPLLVLFSFLTDIQSVRQTGHWIHSRLTFPPLLFFSLLNVFSSKELFNDSTDDESPLSLFEFLFRRLLLLLLFGCAISVIDHQQLRIAPGREQRAFMKTWGLWCRLNVCLPLLL